MKNRGIRFSFNAPATLIFCAACLATLLINILTGGAANRAVFSVYRSSLLSPLTYVRFLGHVLGHSGWSHFFGNVMYIMILGPMLEEKYGTAGIVRVFVITALVTGLLSFLLFPHVRMLGASGIVFALILLSSFTKTEKGTIPVTFLIVAALYIGQQVHEALTTQANIAYLAHLGGGVVGAVLGFTMNKIRPHHS